MQNLAVISEIGSGYPIRRDPDFQSIATAIALAEINRKRRRKRRLERDFFYRTKGLDPKCMTYTRMAKRLDADLAQLQMIDEKTVRDHWQEATRDYGYSTRARDRPTEALDIAQKLFERGERVEKRFDSDRKVISCEQCLTVCGKCRRWGVGCTSCRKVDCADCPSQHTGQVPTSTRTEPAVKTRHKKFWLQVKEVMTPAEWEKMWATGKIDALSMRIIRELVHLSDPKEERSLIHTVTKTKRRTEYDEKRPKTRKPRDVTKRRKRNTQPRK